MIPSERRAEAKHNREGYRARKGISESEHLGQVLLRMRAETKALEERVEEARAWKDAYVKKEIAKDVAEIFVDGGLTVEDAVDFLTTAPANFSMGDVDERIKELGGALPYGQEEDDGA